MRELLEQGFEVHVVEDATAGAKDPDLGDGYAAALSNFKYIANGVIKTNDAVSRMGADLITDLLGEEEGSNSEESTELEPATNEATSQPNLNYLEKKLKPSHNERKAVASL